MFKNNIKTDKDIYLDINTVKKNIPQFSSQKLCDMIICDRYFNFGQQISVFCMEELAKRREEGDNFDFENYIEKSYKELPLLNFDIPDIRTILNKVINKK